VQGRIGCVIKPTGKIDPQKRRVWDFPFWLAINDGFSSVAHRYYTLKSCSRQDSTSLASMSGLPVAAPTRWKSARSFTNNSCQSTDCTSGLERANSRGHDGPELFGGPVEFPAAD
jgi:hypothetical protein